MQTFLPHPDFKESMACLDYMRLGKQRVEAKQILNALEKGGGWSNHPAVKMWRGYEDMLKAYHDVAILEWVDRWFNNTMPLFYTLKELDEKLTTGVYPPWFGNEDFHKSHQSNLLRKANAALIKSHELLIDNKVASAVRYKQVFQFYLRIQAEHNWTTKDNLPYIWPV